MQSQNIVLNQDGCEKLKSAIILQAVCDYRNALKVLKNAQNGNRKGKKVEEAKNRKSEVENFFFSSWFTVLTDINPMFLLNELKSEVDEQ